MSTLARLRKRGLPFVEILDRADPPLLLRPAVLRWPLPALPFTTASTRQPSNLSEPLRCEV